MSNQPSNFVINADATLNTQHPIWEMRNLAPITGIALKSSDARDNTQAQSWIMRFGKGAAAAEYGVRTLEAPITTTNAAVVKDPEAVIATIHYAGSILVPSVPSGARGSAALRSWLDQIAGSIFVDPTVRDRDGYMFAEKGRLEAAAANMGPMPPMTKLYVIGSGPCRMIQGIKKDTGFVFDNEGQHGQCCPDNEGVPSPFGPLCYHKIAALLHLGVKIVLPWTWRGLFNWSKEYNAALLRRDALGALTCVYRSRVNAMVRANERADRNERLVTVAL